MIELPQIQGNSHISIHALMGVRSFSTMKVIGTIGTIELQILMDSWSTHIFLGAALVEKLHRPTIQVSSMSVTVANGNKLPCATLCQDFQWVMQGVWFKADVLLIPLGSYDMVLGIQCLQTLNDIIWNFKTLSI